MKRYLHIILELIKYKVSIAVSFTTITGYLVYSGKFDMGTVYLALSIFLLAGGSSAMNECQESDYDALMDRTKNRPIPSGKITRTNAWIVSIAITLIGLGMLYWIFNPITALLGVINLIWYNVIYTNLKRVSSFAVVPGSMVGAIPVLMGWTAAGGVWYEATIIFIAFFLFIWQVPHFWLLMLKYNKEYENAGFKTINQAVHPQHLKHVIFAWIVATSFTSIIVPLFLTQLSLSFFVLIFVLNILFIGVFTKLTFSDVLELNFRKSFITINLYMMLFMTLLITYHIVF
jgi:protoheme IX farnesyltransferase